MTDRARFEAAFPSRNKWIGHRYDHHLDQARWGAYQEGLRAARAWRPISEAPKDGTPVDVWCVPPDGCDSPVSGIRLTNVAWADPDDISPCAGWVRIMDDGNEDYVERDAEHPLGLPAWKPTHFQPLPPPPEHTASIGGQSD